MVNLYTNYAQPVLTAVADTINFAANRTETVLAPVRNAIHAKAPLLAWPNHAYLEKISPYLPAVMGGALVASAGTKRTGYVAPILGGTAFIALAMLGTDEKGELGATAIVAGAGALAVVAGRVIHAASHLCCCASKHRKKAD